ncbi:hypothetical protein BGZ83_005583 [Gryganskiella cystojenkinii]|nr:hypothetical protein BGZ83_005583 [Gryganskiella cystojenkinii]
MRPTVCFGVSTIKTAVSVSVPIMLLKRPMYSLSMVTEQLTTEREIEAFSRWREVSNIVLFDATGSVPVKGTPMFCIAQKFRKEGFRARIGYINEAKPFLYRRPYFSISGTPKAYIEAMKANRRHIREVELWNDPDIEYDLLDLILDFRSPVPLSRLESDNDDQEDDGEDEEKFVVKPGPNQLKILSFRFSGSVDNFERFYDLLYNLRHLIKLDLSCWEYSQEFKTNDVDLGRLLERMPQLAHLSIYGCGYELMNPSSPTSVLYQRDQPHYRLEYFSFQSILLDTTKKEHYRLFRRLGNLTSIRVQGYASYVDRFFDRFVPRNFTWALEQCCPKLKEIQVCGNIPLELYRLSASISTLPETQTKDPSTSTPSELDSELASNLGEQQQGSSSSQPTPRLFSNLSKFEALHSCSISSADLSYLRIHCQFLTHLEIHSNTRLDSNLCNSQAAESSSWYPVSDESVYSALPQPKPHESHITSLDLQLLLEHCAHLRHFSAGMRMIQVHDMVQPVTVTGTTEAATASSSPLSLQGLSGYYQSNFGHLFPLREAKPWACEKTLEHLSIGFRVASASRSDHQVVYRQLARLSKLKSLYLPRTNLIPALGYGLELLGEGGCCGSGGNDNEVQDENQSKTLRVLSFGDMPWALDQIEVFAWLTKAFPYLKRIEMKVGPASHAIQDFKDLCSKSGVTL